MAHLPLPDADLERVADGPPLQARPVLGWKAAEYAGLAAFTVLVPRLMGPETYGRFAGVFGSVGLLITLSGVGAQATLGRFVPEYQATGRGDRIRALFMQVLAARLGASALLAAALALVLPRLMPEVSPAGTALAAGTVIVGAVGTACFQLYYGLNRLDRWLVRDALVRPALGVLLLGTGGLAVLDRAVLALFLAEAAFLGLGLVWARGYFSRERWESGPAGFASHLRFGLLFFGANLLLIAVWKGGELTLLVLSADRAQIGFFNIANAVAMAFGALMGQLASLLIPSLTTFHVSGEGRRVDAWLGYSLKYLTVVTIAFVILVDAGGAWAVHHALGEGYASVVPNLQILTFGLLPLGLVRTAVSGAMVAKEPARAVRIGAAGMGAFVVLAALLVPARGALGASVAIAGALGAAGLVAYRQFRMSEVLQAARFWRVVLPGIPALALTALPGLAPLPGGVAALAVYGGGVALAGGLTRDEVRKLAHAVVRT